MRRIILFDGFCNLCSTWVRVLHRLDRKQVFQFAPLQSPEIQAMISRASPEPPAADSVLYLEKGDFYQKSEAVLRILGALSFPWNLFRIFMVIPRPIRDRIYDFVARHRYRWFGKKDHCLLPSASLKDRFLNSSSESMPNPSLIPQKSGMIKRNGHDQGGTRC
jgi:predicted DCC family thiol-disulfide oxidoreductase YuxK